MAASRSPVCHRLVSKRCTQSYRGAIIGSRVARVPQGGLPMDRTNRPTERISGAALLVAGWLALCTVALGAEVDPPTFERDVWPILATRCTACHAGDEPKGGLDLRSVASILRGGD